MELKISKDIIEGHLGDLSTQNALRFLETNNDDFLKLIALKLATVLGTQHEMCACAYLLHSVIARKLNGQSWLSVCLDLIQSISDDPQALLRLTAALDDLLLERVHETPEDNPQLQ